MLQSSQIVAYTVALGIAAIPGPGMAALMAGSAGGGASVPMGGRDVVSAWIGGFTITIGNPKTIAFYLALLPLVLNLATVSLRAWGPVLLPITVAVLAAVGSRLRPRGAEPAPAPVHPGCPACSIPGSRRDHGDGRTADAGQGLTRWPDGQAGERFADPCGA